MRTNCRNSARNGKDGWSSAGFRFGSGTTTPNTLGGVARLKPVPKRLGQSKLAE
jgi:hypothetical protein